jgi:hypothetical protein
MYSCITQPGIYQCKNVKTIKGHVGSWGDNARCDNTELKVSQEVNSATFLVYLIFVRHASWYTHSPAGCVSQQYTIKPINPAVKVWLAA